MTAYLLCYISRDSSKCVDWIKENLRKKNLTNHDIQVKTIDQCRGLEYEFLVTISNASNSRGGYVAKTSPILDLYTRVTSSLFIIHMNDKSFSLCPGILDIDDAVDTHNDMHMFNDANQI